jgi:hypothetical protein
VAWRDRLIEIGALDTSSRTAVSAVLQIGPDGRWYLWLTSFGDTRDGLLRVPCHRIVIPAGQIRELITLLDAAAAATPR